MPNWVYNNINVSASNSKDLEEFVTHIKKIPSYYEAPEGQTEMGDTNFSFHSFITLDESKKEEYYTVNGFGPDGKTGDTKFNWYNWNNANWDTKWDASDPSVEVFTHEVVIRFSTAWSPPDPVFLAMSKMFPKLTFDIEWEEEQGFGATLSLTDGQLSNLSTWDIPNSHADYVARDNEDGCVCSWMEDKEDWYSDCPNNEPEEFVFEIVNKVIVKAYSEHDARQAIEAHENNFDLPHGAEIIKYEYNNEYRYIKEEKETE